MKKSTLISLIVAALLVVLGAGLFCGAMSAVDWDFTALSGYEYVTNTTEIPKPFVGIEIESSTADICFAVSEDGGKRVECGDIQSIEYHVEVDNGILKIRAVDTRKWYEHLSIGFTPAAHLTVYLPAGEYGSLCIKESTGDIEICEGFAFFEMDLQLSTGDIVSYADTTGTCRIATTTGDVKVQGASVGHLALRTTSGDITVSDVVCAGNFSANVRTGYTCLTNLTCTDLTSTGTTGELNLTNVIASGKLDITRDTGDVTFEGADAESIKVHTSTGDVKGTLLSDKIFRYKTSTGRVELPQTTIGGVCDITTDTGDIIIWIK